MSEYRLRRRVQFAETDLAGFVHFSCFYRYMEEAEHALWRDAGLSIAPPHSEIGWPRLSASFEFHRVLRFEEEFEAWIRVTEITARTMSYSCLITRDAIKIATGAMTIACVLKRPDEPIRSMDIPPDIAARFRAAAS